MLYIRCSTAAFVELKITLKGISQTLITWHGSHPDLAEFLNENQSSLWLNVRVTGQGAGGEAQFLKVRWLGFAAWHMTPAHLIPSLESITTQRSPSETTTDNKLPEVRNRPWWHKQAAIPEENGEYPPHMLYVDAHTTHQQPLTYRRRLSDQPSSISYAASITCFFWSIEGIESVFTYIICAPKHLTEENKRILQCPEIHLTLCINIVLRS